jgi:hypothetical protein
MKYAKKYNGYGKYEFEQNEEEQRLICSDDSSNMCYFITDSYEE